MGGTKGFGTWSLWHAAAAAGCSGGNSCRLLASSGWLGVRTISATIIKLVPFLKTLGTLTICLFYIYSIIGMSLFGKIMGGTKDINGQLQPPNPSMCRNGDSGVVDWRSGGPLGVVGLDLCGDGHVASAVFVA